jgi:hypothetical protein
LRTCYTRGGAASRTAAGSSVTSQRSSAGSRKP